VLSARFTNFVFSMSVAVVSTFALPRAPRTDSKPL
jgi:hypothetical protein